MKKKKSVFFQPNVFLSSADVVGREREVGGRTMFNEAGVMGADGHQPS